MKKLICSVFFIFILGFYSSLKAQCPFFLNGPFPLPEMQNYNCDIGICDASQLIPAPWQPGDAWQLDNLTPFTDYFFDFGVDPATALIDLEITVFDGLNQIVAHNIGSQIVFQVPVLDNYFITVSEVGNCGAPIPFVFNEFLIDALCPLFCPLDRATALELLLDPTSGFVMDPIVQNLWCPYEDYGAGLGYEGLLPPGTLFGQYIDLVSDNPLPPEEINSPTYLFFWDMFPTAKFAHDIAYITVDALHPNPVFGDGINIYPGQWWPYILLPGSAVPIEYYNSADLFYTDFIPDAFNINGLCSGTSVATVENIVCPEPTLVNKTNNKCALIFAGSDETRIQNSVKKAKKRINDKDCYDKDRIFVVNNGNAGTQQQLCDAIDNMLMTDPACEEYCIHITAHGDPTGGFTVKNGFITPNEWAAKMRKIGAKGKKVHITLETCHSEAMGNPYTWGLPEGSSVTFAASASQTSWSYTYTAPDGTKINEDILSHAITACREDTTDENPMDGIPDADLNKDGTIDGKEGFKWMVKTKPCYTDPKGVMDYPAGPPVGSTGYNPMPSQVCIGKAAVSVSRRYKIPAAADYDKICMVFKGDVTAGMGLVYDNAMYNLISTTLTQNLIMIGGVQHTEVCFQNANKFKKCDSYWVHYYSTNGTKLQQTRAFVRNCPPFTEIISNEKSIIATSEDYPTTDTQVALSLDGADLTVTTTNQGILNGGFGEPLTVSIGYRIASDSIPFELVNFGNTEYMSLPLIPLTTLLLDTMENLQFILPIPDDILPGEVLLVETNHNWVTNSNTSIQVDQFEGLGTALCENDITYTSLNIIPSLTNSDGFITLDNVVINNPISAFNAATEINLLPGTEVPINKEVDFYILGCEQ